MSPHINAIKGAFTGVAMVAILYLLTVLVFCL